MFSTFINAWKIPDLRKKILYTLFIVLLFRIGSAIPVPFLNIAGEIATQEGTILTYLSMMTGSAFNYGAVFAMSISPYINASIIMQLLGVAIPALERLQKEGEEGRKKIGAYTRYLTVGLSLLQSTAYYFYLRNSYSNGSNYLMTDANGDPFTGVWMILQAVTIVVVLTAGSALVMWLGEQVNEKGIGNGISIILFAGIVSRMPTMIAQYKSYFDRGGIYYGLVVLVVAIFLGTIAFIVWMDNAERRLPVQYAKRVVGRKMYGGQSTYMPIKVNMSGVLPVIFASSILSLPGTVALFVTVSESSGWNTFFNIFQPDHWAYGIMYFFLIIFFAYFYSTIQYNPIEMANNLRKNSGAIPGIRPGKPTSDYIMRIMSRITLLGALLLSVIALFPILFSLVTAFVADKWPSVMPTPTDGTPGMSISLGGTSLIILVGVALETVKQLESQMMMRHYKGFLD